MGVIEGFAACKQCGVINESNDSFVRIAVVFCAYEGGRCIWQDYQLSVICPVASVGVGVRVFVVSPNAMCLSSLVKLIGELVVQFSLCTRWRS